jgi:hypothetical protein
VDDGNAYEVLVIHWHNLRYVLRHKWFVFCECRRLGVPWLGIIHDWSKFLPDEWLPYTRCVYDGRSVCRSAPRHPSGPIREAFDLAILRHQRRNRHHWQHWVLIDDMEGVRLLPIPDRYLREMAADWIGASAARGGNVLDWWAAHGHKVLMHEVSLRRFRELLGVAEPL